MKTTSVTTRVTCGLFGLSLSAWLLAFALGLFPDRQAAVFEGRAALCKNVAWHCSLLAGREDLRTVKAALKALVDGNHEVRSAAIRRTDGAMLVSLGDHESHWSLPPGNGSTATQMRVPLHSGQTNLGSLELAFGQKSAGGILGWFGHPLVGLITWVGAVSFLAYFLYLKKMIQHLDPSRVISPQVRETLDTLNEGLLVIDKHESIVLANRSFAERLGMMADELSGRKVSDLPWVNEGNRLTIEGYPWQRTIECGAPQFGELLGLRDDHEQKRVLKVSTVPMYGEGGRQGGVLATFDDVTQFERNRTELSELLEALSQSRDEIHRQNLELERLASRDSLTGCLNRRAFFSDLSGCWSTLQRHDYPLACIVVDLDHFKSINDAHGHRAGDRVLQKAAELIRLSRRPSDLICRYGGEEFCLVLPHTDIDAAHLVAEQIRMAIEEADFNGLSATASVGVSARGLGARDPQELIDQADKCMYIAKQEGRNRVVRFDEAAERVAEFDATGARSRETSVAAAAEDDRQASIPFDAVTGLISALAYRDPATADHSRRVADLCVATVRRLMSVNQSYVLEVAALLHDIGKIGVPDSILLKPGEFTEEEWQVMNAQTRIGAEIVNSTFSSAALSEIMRTYRAWFGGDPRHPEMPTGEDIPLAARTLAIADAYDSMSRDQTYRHPFGRDKAFAELRRCAGRQFDPEMVERFIDTVTELDVVQGAVPAGKPKSIVLGIGTQIDRLAEALKDNDLDGIAVLARRLNLTAVNCDPEIADGAAKLADAARGETDVQQLLQLTADLLDLGRSSQGAYLDTCYGNSSDSDQVDEATSVTSASIDALPDKNSSLVSTEAVVEPTHADP